MTERYTLPYRLSADNLTEEEWGQLPPLAVDCRQWLFPDNSPETEVRACYDEEAINVHFRVYEASPTVRHTKDNAPVYEDSCVEFFLLSLPGKDERYVNFEWNAAGALLLQIGEMGKERLAIEIGRRHFDVRSEIGLPDPASGVIYWKLAFRIPFGFLRLWYPDFQPAPGLVMRGNFYKCGDKTPAPHYISWRPVASETPNFHRTDSFGELVLGEYDSDRS